MKQFEISERFSVSADELYTAWLDSRQHGEMTGGAAEIDARVGGKFTAWDEYICGETLELDKNRRIVQSWRTVEFADTEDDSHLEIEFIPEDGSTTLTLRHSLIPEGQPDYKQGWVDNYFIPMHDFFDS